MAPSSETPTVVRLLAEPGTVERADRELLLAAALGRSRAWLFAHDDYRPEAGALAHYRCWLDRRSAGEPVAYILGERGFWTLDLAVSPDTLIPRPETEHLVEQALRVLAGLARPRILDLGTGSGAIALALASERPDALVLAVDSSPAALAVARANARRHGLDGVRFLAGSWYEPVAGQHFDLIVANPPYLADDDPHLMKGDLPAEPRTALASGPTGLEDLRAIIDGAPAQLADRGTLIVEHGWTQQREVLALCRAAGLGEAAGYADLAGHPRGVVARQAAASNRSITATDRPM